jgi:hypothetical protein
VLKFKEITREEKNTKISGNLGAFCFRPIFIIGEHPIIDNISFIPLVEHYVSSFFLQEEALQNVIKGLIMLQVQSSGNLPKKFPIFIFKIFIIIKTKTREEDFE